MGFDKALIARKRVENFGNAVSDVVAHHIADEKRGEENAHRGVNQVKRVGTVDSKVVCEPMFDEMDEPFQEVGRNARSESHAEAEDEHKVPLCETTLRESKQPFRQSQGRR